MGKRKMFKNQAQRNLFKKHEFIGGNLSGAFHYGFEREISCSNCGEI